MPRLSMLLLALFITVGCGEPAPPIAENRAALNPDYACDQFGCISLSAFSTAIKNILNGNVVGYAAKVGALPAVTGGLARTATDSPPSGVAMSTSRNIQIASLSKLVTTVAALQVMNQKISLDASIAPYLWPSWTQGSNVNKITFRDLLTHRSGIYSPASTPGGPTGDPCGGSTTDFATLKGIIAGGVPTSQLGTAAYSNCNFALFRELLPFMLGYRYTGGDDDGQRAAWSMLIYEAYVRQYVFTPLGFSDVFCTGVPASDVLAYPYPAGSSSGWDTDFTTATCGGGGWYLSLDDLALFANDLARGNQMLTALEKADMVSGPLGWDNSVNNCTNPSFCKNGGMTSSSNQQVNTYLGIVKCNQPVVAVVNSPLPAPYNGPGAITQLIAAAMKSAAVSQATAPATCCDGSAPCGGPGGPCCSSAQTCTAAGTCVANPVCEGIGYPCHSGGDCCSGMCTNNACACVHAGGSCAQGPCCGGYVCSAGVCKVPVVDTCNGRKKPTGGCSSTWNCCGDDGWECGRCK